MMEQKLVCGASCYLSMAKGAVRLGYPDNAHHALTQSLKEDPNYFAAKLYMVEVLIRLWRPQDACDLARKLLAQNPDNLEARNLFAATLVNIGEFEEALLEYSRGLIQRKQPPEFMNGYLTGLEMLENCIGRKSGPIMRLVSKWGPKVIEYKNKSEQELYMLEHKMKHKKELLLEYCLGKMKKDYDFLEYLYNNEYLKGIDPDSYKNIMNELIECKKRLNTAVDILQARDPCHVREVNKPIYSERMNAERTIVLKKKITSIREKFGFYMDLLDVYNSKMNYKNFIYTADKMCDILDRYPNWIIQDRYNKISELCSKVAYLYMSLRRLNPKKSMDENREEIRNFFGINGDDPCKIDPFLANDPMPFYNYKKSVLRTIKLLQKATTHMEQIWYNYEISRLYVLMKSFKLARQYSKQGLHLARMHQEQVWEFNIVLNVAKADAMQQNKTEAKFALKDLIALTTNMQQPHSKAYINQCMSVLNNWEVTDMELKAVTKRCDDVINMMTYELRGPMEKLFQHMLSLPASHRLTIIPGVVIRKPKKRSVNIPIPPPVKKPKKVKRRRRRLHSHIARQTFFQIN